MSSSRTETVDVAMPQMGVSVAEGMVAEWHKQPGDWVAADEPLCVISTDKIDTDVPAPASGRVVEILVPEGETVDVGTVLARIDTEASPGESHAAEEVHVGNGDRAHRYSPVVTRMAAEHGIDLSSIEGTGRGGRVTKKDVLALIERREEVAPPLHIESPYQPEPAAEGGETLSRMRRTIGEHMKRSLETAATCTTWIEADMSRIEAARERLGLTALPFVARCAVAALREHPELNAWLEGERYTRHNAVHLGIAVSLGDEGLIVPVIRDAHELSAEGLAKRVKDVARRARDGSLSPDDVRGGTFTITNPGQYGSIMATPVINQPQVAILDLEAIVKRAVVIDDAIAIRPMTIFGLSWDHRALDGVLAAQFLASLKRHVEGWDGT
jgi:pyruvate/2-oxoglutarate dehydrogenase complex dihydrolipoamide acyltransferase (E2) component